MQLHLPLPLQGALWAHAAREAPRECVGAIGGKLVGGDAFSHTLYPLPNIAGHPESEYLADPGFLVRAFKAMRAEDYTLVGLYHSHPRGPTQFSRSDVRLAAYDVPYVIADLQTRSLRAYLLPEGELVEIVG